MSELLLRLFRWLARRHDPQSGDGVERLQPQDGTFDEKIEQLKKQQQGNEKRVSFAELQLKAIQRRSPRK